MSEHPRHTFPPPGSEPSPQARRLFNAGALAMVVGVAGLGLSAIALFNHDQGRAEFFRAYLFSYLFWLAIALGSMGIVMMQHLTGGAWGLLIRRLGEAAAMTTPLMLLLFLPMLAGLRGTYPWADPQRVQEDVVLHHRAPYLNWQWWLIRAL